VQMSDLKPCGMLAGQMSWVVPCTFLDIFIILFLFVTGYADLMHMFSYNFIDCW
jgi:hypothetical protein